jgi:hydroxymethylpyrimidine pyrophosphatase-like HAD family hydrolase
VYLDLDRTLLGRGGSLFHDGEGAYSSLGARAVGRCLQEGVEVVVTTGRALDRVREPARIFGQRSLVFEAGAGVVVDGETRWLTGSLSARAGLSVHDQIAARAVPELLLERFAGCLAYPDHKNRGRLVTHVFRGLVDVDEARAVLAAEGHGDLHLLDNGARAGGRAHVYHLAPVGTGKAAGVACHQRARGYERSECIAVGDSREDLSVAEHVGTFWLVANALDSDPELAGLAAARGNVRIAEHANGAGVDEAVAAALVEVTAAAGG